MRKLHTFLLIISSTVLLSCFVPAVAFAQDPAPAPLAVAADPSPDSPPVLSGKLGSLMTNREFQLSLLILIFGVVIVVIQYLLLRGVVKQKTEVISRTYTVTLIIVGTMFLITAGYDSE